MYPATTFQTNLIDSLRILLQKENTFINGFKTPDYEKNIRPMIIPLDTTLREMGYLDYSVRKRFRLFILAKILQKDIKTSYDLSAYQCAVISNFLRDLDNQEQPGENGFGKNAREFLKSFEKLFESSRN